MQDETLDAGLDRRQLRHWLYLCTGLIALMVVVGGFVRLSRAGLSIVQWDPLMGVLPPIGDAAWQRAHDLYLASPEGMKVNAGMSVAEYQRIFYIEWFHRLLARVVGLVVALPLLWFLLRGVIPRGRRLAFVSIGLLFAFQGFLGWFMVASGLVDRPSVSHYRLTLHLLAALALLALCLWQALGLRDADAPPVASRAPLSSRRLGLALMGLVLVQIGWGGLVAGLKAGHVSNTWPQMFGHLIPAELLGRTAPLWRDLFDNPVTVHFLHRWLAWLVLALAGLCWWQLRDHGAAPEEQRAAALLLGLLLLQVGLGVATVLLGVQIWVALAHQASAVLLFATTIYLNQRLQRG